MKRICFLESRIYYEKLGIEIDSGIYNARLKIPLGLVSLNEVGVLVLTLEHSFINQLLVRWANKMMIPVVYVVDGVFEWRNSFSNPRLNGKQLFLMNEYNRIYLCSDFTIINFLRVLGHDVHFFKNPRVLGNLDIIQADMKLQNEKYSRFLITTANTACFDKQERQRLGNLIRSFCHMLNERNLEYAFRIFDLELYDLLNESESKNCIEGSFSELMGSIDVVVSTTSSIMYEASAFGKRVVSMLYRDVPITIGCGWYLHASVDMGLLLDSLLVPSVTENDIFQWSSLQSDDTQYPLDRSSPEDIKQFLLDKAAESERKYTFFEKLDVFWRLPFEILFK